MLFLCSDCNQSFEVAENLILHYKYVYDYKHNSAYTCAQNECYRKYTKSYDFIKHLNSHAATTDEVSKTEIKDYSFIVHDAMILHSPKISSDNTTWTKNEKCFQKPTFN